jgi:hypothetical protein
MVKQKIKTRTRNLRYLTKIAGRLKFFQQCISDSFSELFDEAILNGLKIEVGKRLRL